MENTLSNTIYATYAWCTMGGLDAIPSNIQRLSCVQICCISYNMQTWYKVPYAQDCFGIYIWPFSASRFEDSYKMVPESTPLLSPHLQVGSSVPTCPPVRRRVMTTGYPSTMMIRLPIDRLIIRGVKALRTCSGLRRMRTVSVLPRKPIDRMRNITIPYVRYQASCQLKVDPCSCSFEFDMFLCQGELKS